MEAYLRSSLAEDTWHQYATAHASYRAYCAEPRHPRPDWLPDEPITAERAAEWLAALADRGRHASKTILAYRSALRTYAELERSLGATHANPLDDPLIKRLSRGIELARAPLEAARRAAAPPAAPLTFDMVRAVRANYALEDPRDAMHYAALTLAVASAARPSEVFGSRAHPDRAVRARQVRFFADRLGTESLDPRAGPAVPDHYTFTLEVSKTDQRRAGIVKIVAAPTAVAALWQHCRSQQASGDEHLFSMGGRVLTQYAAIARARLALIAIGETGLAARLAGRSFRRGGASTLAAAGASADTIAALGWAAGSKVGLEVYANDPAVQRARARAIHLQMEPAAAAAAAAAVARSARP